MSDSPVGRQDARPGHEPVAAPPPWRSIVDRWLDRRRSLYSEWEGIREVDAQGRTLVDELRRRRDGMQPRHLDLWAIR